MKPEKKRFYLIDIFFLIIPVLLFSLGIYIILNYERMAGVEIWKYFRNLAYLVYSGALVISVLLKLFKKTVLLKTIITGLILSTFSYALAGLALDIIKIGYSIIRIPFGQIIK